MSGEEAAPGIGPALLKYVAGPIAVGIVSAVVGYCLGRKSKVDEVLIKRKLDLADELAIAAQSFIDTYKLIDESLIRHFGRYESTIEAAEHLDSWDLYKSDRKLVSHFFELRGQLAEKLQRANPYFTPKLLDPLHKLDATFYFVFQTDEIGFDDTHTESLLKCFLDKDLRNKRFELISKILQNLNGLMKV